MRCLICGMSNNNTVHIQKNQFGYHEYVDTPEQPYVKSNEERIEELEERIQKLENRLSEVEFPSNPMEE